MAPAGEGRCVVRRVSVIIFDYNRSLQCQEDHPPAGTVCKLHREVWEVVVSKRHSVPYKTSKGALEWNAVRRSAGRLHPFLETFEEVVLMGSTLLDIPRSL